MQQKRITLYNISESDARELVWRYFSEPDLGLGLQKQLEFYNHYQSSFQNNLSELLWTYMYSCYGNTFPCPYSGLDTDPFKGFIEELNYTNEIVQVGDTSLIHGPLTTPVIDTGCVNLGSTLSALGISHSWELSRDYTERFKNALTALLYEAYHSFGLDKIRVLEDRYVLILYRTGLGLLATQVN